MELATLALLSLNELKKHQRLHPAPFEKIVISNQRLTRYYGPNNAVCYGEWVRDVLDKPPQLSIYLEQKEMNAWYGCAMDEDGVLIERIGSFALLCDVLAYDLHQASTIYITHDLPSQPDGIKDKDVRAVTLPSNDEEALAPYRLTKHQSKKPLLLACLGLAGALLGVGGYVMAPDSPAPQRVAVPLSQEMRYQAQYHTSVLPNVAIIDARNALLSTTLFPHGVNANTVSFQNGQLSLPITMEPSANLNEWQQWLDNHAAFLTHYEAQTLTLTPTMHTGELPRYDMSVQHDVVQRLHSMGIDVLQNTQDKRIGALLINQYQLSATVPLGSLNILSEILNHPMISLDAISLTLNDTMTVTGTIGITLQGIK